MDAPFCNARLWWSWSWRPLDRRAAVGAAAGQAVALYKGKRPASGPADLMCQHNEPTTASGPCQMASKRSPAAVVTAATGATTATDTPFFTGLCQLAPCHTHCCSSHSPACVCRQHLHLMGLLHHFLHTRKRQQLSTGGRGEAAPCRAGRVGLTQRMLSVVHDGFAIALLKTAPSCCGAKERPFVTPRSWVQEVLSSRSHMHGGTDVQVCHFGVQVQPPVASALAPHASMAAACVTGSG